MVRKVIVSPAPGAPKAAFVEKRSKWKVPFDVLKEYLSSSTLHGLSYLHKEGLTKIERIWWSISVIITVILSFYLIGDAYVKWINNPIVIALENKKRPIFTVPFPAITICPSIKFQHQNELLHRHFLKTFSSEEYKKLMHMYQICHEGIYGHRLKCSLNVTDHTLTTDLLEGFNTESNSFPSRKYFNKVFNIPENNQIFAHSYILTEEGYCVSFNIVVPQQMFTNKVTKKVGYIITRHKQNITWDVENGFYETAKSASIPFRTFKSGGEGQCEIFNKQFELFRNILCDLPFRGYKIMIHNPAEMPRVMEQYHIIPENGIITFAVEPNLITSSEKIKSISSESRKCYFSNERPLTFYRYYTQANCHVECLSNLTLHYCGCVQFYMPKNDSTKLCACGRQQCAKKVKDIYVKLNMEDKVNNILNKSTKHNIFHEQDMKYIYKNCKCLPSCTNLDYKVSISEAESHFFEMLRIRYSNDTNFALNDKQLQIAQVNVFFEKSDFVAYERRELYETVDFLANCASLLAVFLGFSLQSIVEILYFATLRLFVKYIQYFTNNEIS